MSTPKIIVACETLGITLDTPYKTAYSRHRRSGKPHPEAWQLVKTHLPKTRQEADTPTSATGHLRRITLRRSAGANVFHRLAYILGTGSKLGPYMTVIHYCRRGNRYQIENNWLEDCVPPVDIHQRDMVLTDGVDCRVELLDVGCRDWEPWTISCVAPNFSTEGYAE